MSTRLDIPRTLELIDKHYGNITVVARALGVTRQTVYNAIDAVPELKEAIDSARETGLDIAESSLMKQIGEGNTAATIFLLKTRGKSRGYVERQELTGADGGAIKTESAVKIYLPDNERDAGESDGDDAGD